MTGASTPKFWRRASICFSPWGTWGDFPGAFWGVHGFGVDQEGNVYTAAVDSGGAQKCTPRKGAHPALMLGKPFRSAWK